jgi:hypothetical protein
MPVRTGVDGARAFAEQRGPSRRVGSPESGFVAREGVMTWTGVYSAFAILCLVLPMLALAAWLWKSGSDG